MKHVVSQKTKISQLLFQATASNHSHVTIFILPLAEENTDVKINFFIFNLCGGTLGNAATIGLLYQPRMIGDDDCKEIGGIKIERGNRSTLRKPAPAPLCPPQIPHD
jgi:hypothetical protein